MTDTDTSSWSWAERMGERGIDNLTATDKLILQDMRDDMELARLAYLDAKAAYDRACDAVYVFVRSKRESR